MSKLIKTYNKERICNNLIHLRINDGYTQHQLAFEIGIKRCTIASYEEQGRNVPSLENLIKYSNFFNVSIDDIITKKLWH